MKTSDWVFKVLSESGMMPDDASTVLEKMKNDDFFKTSIKWNDDLDGYPLVFKAALLNSVNSFAIKWIDENMPNAWFRSMFL